jgi:hypothetical protein
MDSRFALPQSMTRKSGNHRSDEIMLQRFIGA